MRGDQLATDRITKTPNVNYRKASHARSSHNRVDINDLINRVRENEKKQKKENLVFFGIVASVIVITGIIASL